MADDSAKKSTSNLKRKQDEDDYNRRANDELPQPFDARSLEPAKKRARSKSPSADQPRKPKRPGQRARINESEREAIRQRALARERQMAEADERQRQQQQQHQEQHQRHGQDNRGRIDDVVRSHYNAVPERGREWRKTASTIRGLRSFNNWIKSCIIQKFSPSEDFDERRGSGEKRTELLVLDIGCGKGGDLGKWNQAPQRVQLYVGLDPADVSIDQARDRYREMMQRSRGGGGRGRGGHHHHRGGPPSIFEGRFLVKDCFGESLGDLPIVRDVGFDTNPLSTRGFDVVSMMFCMHYAFETEEKARTMLRNVSAALKKGGRLIGCIPDSDVIGERVRQFHAQQAKKAEEKEKREKEGKEEGDKEGKEEGDKEGKEEGDKEGKEEGDKEGKEEGDKEGKEEGDKEGKEEGEADATQEPVAEWGNSIYRVRFPGATPADGVFRPPFGWKYNFFLNEAVEEVPEYVVPWHAFRALAEDYNLELQYHKQFTEIWDTEKDDRILGPLSERMSVRDRNSGDLLVNAEEMEAASLYVGFCFYKV